VLVGGFTVAVLVETEQGLRMGRGGTAAAATTTATRGLRFDRRRFSFGLGLGDWIE
jgi:hypothetical protein